MSVEAGPFGGVWGVVNTHPNREHIAVENLDRQGFTAYCPMIRRRIRHARRTQDVLRPMFGGYIFVHVDPQRERWRPILSTFGVRALVRFGDQIGRLDPDFVTALRAREVDGAIIRPERPFQVGQEVRMSGGPFDGLVATIVEMDDKARLTVLMNLLNQPVRVKVRPESVAALSS